MSTKNMAQNRALIRTANMEIQFSYFDPDNGSPAAMGDWLVDWQERVGTME